MARSDRQPPSCMLLLLHGTERPVPLHLVGGIVHKPSQILLRTFGLDSTETLVLVLR
jgi:hypothetical protein